MSPEEFVNAAMCFAEELEAVTGHEIYCIDVLEALANSGFLLVAEQYVAGDFK